MIKVVIIDDGLCNDGKIKINESYVYRFGRFNKVKNKNKVSYNHGTICAKIINAPNTIFTSVKIIHNGHPVGIDVLKKAIEFSCKLLPDVIHISLGSFSWHANSIKKVITDFTEFSKVIIVASADPYGKRTYPSCFDCVIGVSHSDFVSENNFVSVLPNITGVNIYTSGPTCFLDANNNKISIPKTSSYAAAIVTHKLCLWLQNQTNRNIDSFLFWLDNQHTPATSSRLLEDRTLVIVYNGKKPQIKRASIVFGFSEILFYDTLDELSLKRLHDKKICIAFDKSVSSFNITSRLEELINNNDVILIANDHIHKLVVNADKNQKVMLWRNPSNYSVYNRLIPINKKNEMICFNGMSGFIKYTKHLDDFFPITTNPLNEIYGIVYTENIATFMKKTKHGLIVCVN